MDKYYTCQDLWKRFKRIIIYPRLHGGQKRPVQKQRGIAGSTSGGDNIFILSFWLDSRSWLLGADFLNFVYCDTDLLTLYNGIDYTTEAEYGC